MGTMVLDRPFNFNRPLWIVVVVVVVVVVFFSTVQFFYHTKKVKFWIFTSLNIVYSDISSGVQNVCTVWIPYSFGKRRKVLLCKRSLKDVRSLVLCYAMYMYMYMYMYMCMCIHECFYDEFKMSISILW